MNPEGVWSADIQAMGESPGTGLELNELFSTLVHVQVIWKFP